MIDIIAFTLGIIFGVSIISISFYFSVSKINSSIALSLSNIDNAINEYKDIYIYSLEQSFLEDKVHPIPLDDRGRSPKA